MKALTTKQMHKIEIEVLEEKLNTKIMLVTTEIKEHYPELIKFLKEMPLTVSDEKDSDSNLKSLKLYYDSLNTVLNDYISEQA
jgi:phosphopantetheinyl transferase (holo-ACP synthase)